MLKRVILLSAAAIVAVAPAAVGLAGNSSLSPSVPVAPPTQAVLVDDHGGSGRDARTEAGDDRQSPSPSATPSVTPDATPSATTAPGSVPTPSAGVDDHGGLVDRDDRVEAGDDRAQNGGASTPATTDDSGHGSDDSGHGSDDSGHSGSDDGSGHDAGDDHGGHGSDD